MSAGRQYLCFSNPHFWFCGSIPDTAYFNVFRADHEDQDVMLFNRMTLPAYYGLLRMCCQQSRAFTRQLGQHQNILWAFKNISPYPAQYPGVSLLLFLPEHLLEQTVHVKSERY